MVVLSNVDLDIILGLGGVCALNRLVVERDGFGFDRE